MIYVMREMKQSARVLFYMGVLLADGSLFYSNFLSLGAIAAFARPSFHALYLARSTYLDSFIATLELSRLGIGNFLGRGYIS